MDSTETIAAISTAYGRGGIAVIRVSGADAVIKCEKVFRPFHGGLLSQISSNCTVYGKILYDGEQIDDGMATVYRAPHSYTGEDTVEISCHGGLLLQQKVLESCFLCGCVQAGPGEFTKRAFLNGKLGLTQAEAIIDLIDARSMEKILLAGAGTRGMLANETDALYAMLRKAVSSTYAYIDFPDEDLTDMTIPELKAVTEEVSARLSKLADSYTHGRAVNEGISCAIVGKPNTGKSSLLNAILGQDRAIVTDIAGTTRDVIEETVPFGRVLLHLSDTAGIHSSEDTVERLGVERSLRAMEQAELIFAVFDVSRPLDEEDRGLAERLSTCTCPVILIENKSDLPKVSDIAELCLHPADVVPISAKEGTGLDVLTKAVNSLFTDGTIDYNTQAVVANSRQYAAVRAALDAVNRALDALRDGFSQDIAGMDLEQALSKLGEVDGRTVSGQIVEDIFHNFCVGK